MKRLSLLILGFGLMCLFLVGKANASCHAAMMDKAYIQKEQAKYEAALKQKAKQTKATKANSGVNTKVLKKANEQEFKTTMAEPLNFSDEDIELLCKICHAESRGESTKGQMAVANVVINRMKSERFPNTVSGVVYQKGQFQPVSSKSFAATVPSEKVRESVRRVLNGERVVEDDVLYFKSVSCKVQWKKLKLRTQIGNHLFYAP
ncbi:MAG: cell wall hydrolase [Clostridia bacterium]|nr:cell wall hydrolase [Clostridia bacterium]